MKSYSPPRFKAGSALIITLFFIGMITVVIVAVLISARLERTAAHSHFDQKRAGEFAREGVERVVATLDRQTAYKYTTTDPVTNQTVYRYRNYLTRPGGLVVPLATPAGDATDAITQNVLAQAVPLSTGLPLGTGYTDPVFAAPSLNIPSFVQQAYPTYLIDDRPAVTNSTGSGATSPKPSAMKLKWVYIHQDPSPPAGFPAMYDDPVDQSVTPDNRANDSRSTDLPKIDTTKPIIGRFAYWTDDESTKINYNLAWKKGTAGSSSSNPSIMADPSRIDLEALLFPPVTGQSPIYLSQAQADTIHKWTAPTPSPAPSPYPGRYFNSFEDARQVGQVDSTIPPVIDYNNFELTHYNHDPDTTFFGEDRILLTTDPRLVPKNPDGSYARKFIDILREDKVPPGGDFRTSVPPDPGVPSNIAGGETDPQNNAVPSGTSYYPGVTVANKLDMVLKNLVRYINQTNWPISSDSTASFQKKYYPTAATNSPATAQLAMAIIDYVRMRESAQQIVPGTRAGYPSGSTTFTTNNTLIANSTNAYQGYGRYPYCTEMGVLMESQASGNVGVTQCEDGTSNKWPLIPGTSNKQPLYRCCAQYEFYLPVKCNLPNGIVFATPLQTAPPTERWVCTPLQNGDKSATRYVEGEDQVMHPVTTIGDFGDYQPAVSLKNCKIYNPPSTSASPPAGTLMPGGYAVVTIPYFRVQPWETKPSNFALRVVLEKNYVMPDGLDTVTINPVGGQGTTTDPNYIRPLIAPQSSSTPVTYSPIQWGGGSYAAFDAACATMLSVETDDPRCYVSPLDWVQGKVPSWGGQSNRWSVGQSPTGISPQQDTDINGKITDYSLYMPPLKNATSTDPENGRVTSVGELGYVSTGLSANAATGSVSWRTFRLQGSNYGGTDVLPDWAFVDLFAVPTINLNTAATAGQPPATGQDLHNPHGNTAGGRVNINSAIIPFTDVARDRALVGLLTGTGSASLLTPTNAGPIAQNIAAQTLVSQTATLTPKKYGAMGLATNPAYDTPGELCEIKQIGDNGESGEDLVRQILSIVCTRGDVFSVYTIGQTLLQNSSGKLIVTAEQRQQSMVERYVANRNTATAQDDQVRFRTVYVRNLTP